MEIIEPKLEVWLSAYLSALGKTRILSPDLVKRIHHSSCQMTIIRHIHNGEHFVSWRLLNCPTFQRKPVVTGFWGATKWFPSSNIRISLWYPFLHFTGSDVFGKCNITKGLLRLGYYSQGTFTLLRSLDELPWIEFTCHALRREQKQYLSLNSLANTYVPGKASEDSGPTGSAGTTSQRKQLLINKPRSSIFFIWKRQQISMFAVGEHWYIFLPVASNEFKMSINV